MNETSNSSVERKFFTITRYFLTAVSVLAMLAAIAGGAVGCYKYLQQVDTSIKPPQVDYEELKRKKQEEKQSKPAPKDAVKSSNDIPVEYLEIMTRIEILLKMFAKTTEQVEPSDNTRTKIYRLAASVEHIPTAYTLKNLEAECKKLEADALRIKMLPLDDAERITWGDFLAFFFDALNSNIARQRASIRQQDQHIQDENRLGLALLQGAGVCFGVSILMLVLVGIENNSRHIHELLRSQVNAT
jgi:hypothetical protein